MPGLLKSNAKCPNCGDPLDALVDETSRAGVRREYFHGKRTRNARRRRKCVRHFKDYAAARRERWSLER